MERITLEDYFGPYLSHPDATALMRANAQALLAKVNVALEQAVGDGIVLVVNPNTGTYVSGEGNGGFRPSDCKVGAVRSEHRYAHAVDLYDPFRRIARWCLQNEAKLRALGIAGMERPEWTPTWTHLQDLPVGSGTWCFIPDRSAPLAGPLPEQLKVGIA